MPETPAIPQKVKFFTARSTFIAESSIEQLSAIEFDAFFLRLFGDTDEIDRSKWEPADRIFALNSALDQTAERRENELPYIRLDEVQKGVFQITLIEPAEPVEETEPAIDSAINEVPIPVAASAPAEPDKLQLTMELLRQNPYATDLEIAAALGLKTQGTARFWKIKARDVLQNGTPPA